MSIARRAASGAAWNLGMGTGVRVLGLVGTLLLTRFLAPIDFGEVSLAVVSAVMAVQLVNLALGSYIIAHRSDPEEAFEAFALHTTLTGLACCVLVIAREPLGHALGSPGMTRYVPGIALAVFVSGTSLIPSATLVRSLRFRAVAVTRAAGELCYTVVSVALAPVIGAYSIVAGNLLRSFLVSGTLFFKADRKEWLQPTRLRRRSLSRMLDFGLPMTGAVLAERASGPGSNLLIARLFGAGTVGTYNLAYNLATTPTANVAEHIGDVLLPSFAQMEDGERRAALPRAASLMALLVFPMAVGLAAVAPTVVTTLLDPRWMDVAPMLALLAAVNLPHPAGWVVQAYLTSERRTRPVLLLGLIKVALIFGLILTVGSAGPLWACFAVGLAFQLFGAACLAIGWTTARLAPGPVIMGMLRPLLAALLMGGAVMGARAWLGQTGWPGLVTEILVGALAYVAAAFVLARQTALELIRLARGVVAARFGSRETASPR